MNFLTRLAWSSSYAVRMTWKCTLRSHRAQVSLMYEISVVGVWQRDGCLHSFREANLWPQDIVVSVEVHMVAREDLVEESRRCFDWQVYLGNMEFIYSSRIHSWCLVVGCFQVGDKRRLCSLCLPGGSMSWPSARHTLQMICPERFRNER
jgi:hypothetical protein